MDNQKEDLIKIYMEYQDKHEFILIAHDSEIFQLKMMICAKFKLYEYDKIIIINKGNILSNEDEKSKIIDFLIPENPETKEYKIKVNYNDENNFKLINNNLKSKKKALNQYKNISHNCKIDNNSYNNLKVYESPSNSIINILPINTNKININKSNIYLNSNLNSPYLKNEDKNKLKEKSSQKQKNKNFFLICKCSDINEATNICLKCDCFLCKYCIKRNSHMLHKNEIIRISKSFEYMKNYINDQNKKLNDNFNNDENFIHMQNFENFFLDFKNKIENNYEYILNVIQNAKTSEIDYLVYLKEKINIQDKFNRLTHDIQDLIKDFEGYNQDEENIENYFIYRKNFLSKYQAIENKYNLLKQIYDSFNNAVSEIDFFNNNFINTVEERIKAAQQLFNIDNINERLSNICLSKEN